MAHYIAEQMTIAENAVGDDKMRAEQKCFETILTLWQHRTSLPIGRRPFENFDPIFRVLKKLDPENGQPYYLGDLFIEDKKINVTDSVQQWLDKALEIDQVVRIWLDYIFKQAALCAKDEKTLKWLENSFGFQDNEDAAIIAHLLHDNILAPNEISDESKKDRKKELIKDRIKKLEEFSEFNQKLLSILKEELANISGDDVSKDEDEAL